jgi:protein-tyrosine phosphatase
MRADSPHRLDMADKRKLYQNNLRMVIDLRAKNELDNAPNPFVDEPKVQYLNISLFEHLAPATMVKQEAGNDDPLLDFYISTLASRQTEICTVLEAIASHQEGLLVFHCTAGKDRTGLIAALLLGLAEVENKDIIADYAQTAPLIVGLVAEFLDLARAKDMDIEAYKKLLKCEPQTMQKALAHVQEAYGSIPQYLTQAGLEQSTRTRLARLMTQ